MSAIKNFLGASRDDFISLRELLDAMAVQEGDSLQDAAQVLCQILARDLSRPPWASYERTYGICSRGEAGDLRADALLTHVATHGEYQKPGFDDDDDIPF